MKIKKEDIEKIGEVAFVIFLFTALIFAWFVF